MSSEPEPLNTTFAKRTLRFLKIDPAQRFPCPKGCTHTALEYLEAVLNAYAVELIDRELKNEPANRLHA